MTQQLTSPSHSSVNENAFRLNSSSGYMISPSQSNFNSSLKNNLVQFEQYKLIIDESDKPSLGLGKKKLTIKIDDSYDHISQQQNTPQPHQGLSQSSTTINCLQIISPIENKNVVNYNQLLEQFDLLKKQCQIKDNIITSLHTLNQEEKSNLRAMQTRIKELQESMNLKNLCILQQNASIQRILTELSEKNEENFQIRQDFERKKKQLKAINEGLTQRNKVLVKEARISDKKIKDLQKESQNNFCLTTQQNLHRLKQSSVKLKQKENLNRYNVKNNSHQKQERDSLQTNKQKEMSFGAFSNISIGNAGRKSLERKKNIQGSTNSVGFLGSKKTKIVSSSSNTILTKKLMQK